MCWISRKQDIKIAEQDIPIFKIMKKTPFPEIVKSIYQDFSYKLNSLTESDIKIKEFNILLFEVNEALHSYNPEKIKCLYLRNSSINIEVSTYFYSRRLDWFSEDKNIIKVKGIIPKSSQYMENENGEFVSNQLILTEICAGLEN